MNDRVLALGVFDLFHVGHLRYLQYASKRGKSLVVGVLPDDIVLKIKNKRPIIPQSERVEIINALDCVNEVRLQPTTTRDCIEATRWIREWNIVHVVAGGCWRDSIHWVHLERLLAKASISVEFAHYSEGISSTDIIKRIKNV